MHLHPEDVSELRRLVREGGSLPVTVPPPSMGAAVELACTALSWRSSGQAAAFGRFREWASDAPLLDEAWASIEGARPMGAEYSAAQRDVRSVTDGTAQSLFANRFRASLLEIGGFSAAFAAGLAGALGEMVDNVLQHSTREVGHGAPAVMAFEVGVRSFSFAVGDVGRGVLNTLRENRRWATLAGDEEALDAVVVHQASRRGSHPGTGFQLVVRTLADLGTFRYRTGSAYVTIETDGPSHTRTTVKGASHPQDGVQLVATSSRET